MESIKSKIQILRGDITKIEADAIVNAANTSLMGGGGVDGAIHRAGGSAILEECRKIVAKQGGCKTGEAVITTAGKLSAKYVIHTVGPVWNGGTKKESEKLASCYINSLKLATQYNCQTIAFPCISTGIYKFPIDLAAEISIQTIGKQLQENSLFQKIVIVCFDEQNYQALNLQWDRVK